MCGIAGIINYDLSPVKLDDLNKMASFIEKRGPDGYGYWIDGGIGFAHRRLSIVDLSDAGKQPMEDNDKCAVITYNGEIYNYLELRDQLLQQGIKFNSSSDTEVIINGCLYWGVQSFLERAEGMFAFVLYNKRTHKIFACRDRLGKKPLYYYSNSEKFVFASDIRSINSVVTGLTIDYESLDYYLTELSTPQPKTIWAQIKQVSPASYIEFGVKEHDLKEYSYWKNNFKNKIKISVDEAIKETERILIEAVMRRTNSDVPIGNLLSSGADSGLITAIHAMHSGKKINTFSVGFNFSEYNELPLARKLAERYDTNHTEIIVTPDIVNDLPTIVAEFGEPFGDSSMIPSYYIAKKIGSNIKVAFSGDGGDEGFGGYYEYPWAINADNFLAENKSKIKRKLLSASSKISYRINSSNNNYGHIEAYADLSGSGKLNRGIGFSQSEKNQLYSNVLKGSSEYSIQYLQNKWDAANNQLIVDNIFEASYNTRLLNDYLPKVDRAFMCNSVEVRSPFLDTKLVEFAATIPAEIKLHKSSAKYILKELARKYIDDQFMERKKMGFGIPLEHWVRNELSKYINEVLFSASFKSRGLFNVEYVEKIIKEHASAKVDHSTKIWLLLCLELWLRQSD